MASIVSSPQSDALEQSLLAEREAPQAALSALQRVRELEREVMLLRSALTDLSEQDRQDMAWQNQVANLLSRIVLFRVALDQQPGHHDKAPGSERKD